MRINVTVRDLLDHETLLEALFAAQLALLMHGDREHAARTSLTCGAWASVEI
jgi:hypothetical protein